MNAPWTIRALVIGVWLGVPRVAEAYRPFDGTDADVAHVGELELELGPSHYYRHGKSGYLVAPATVVNVGFASNLEAVLDFREFVGLERVPGESRVRVLDTDLLVKWVFVRGVLQDEAGPSLALELGPLLPEIEGDYRFGAQANVITSYGGSLGIVHLNTQAARSRRGDLDLFGGLILEGPRKLLVRPVAEVFAARDFGVGSTYSALVGAIAPVRESFALDAGVRLANEEKRRGFEVRFGFTAGWSLWSLRPKP